MTNKFDEVLKTVPDEDLVAMVNELYDWHYKSPCIIPEEAVFRKLCKKLDVVFPRDIEDYVLNEAAERFKHLIKFMLIERPYIFIEAVDKN